MTLNISSLSVIQACGYQGGDAVFEGIRGFISIYSSVFKQFFFFIFFSFCFLTLGLHADNKGKD